MTRALVFLAWHTWLNRTLWRLRRLREPRYLIGAIVAVGYFGMLFFRQGRALPRLSRLDVTLVSVGVLLLMLLAWARRSVTALEFSEAEMHFLFSAPVTRRQILFYKMLRSQPPILAGVAFLALMRFPSGMYAGMWTAYTVMTLHAMFAAVAREKLEELRIRGAWISAAAVAVAVGVAYVVLHSDARWNEPALAPLLFIPRLFAQALFPSSIADLLLRIAILAGVGAALFFGAASMRVRFEELVMTSSERAAKYRARMQGDRSAPSLSLKRIPPLFRLREGAPVELVLAWKNLIALTRMALAGVATILAMMAVVVAMSFFAVDADGRRVIAAISLFYCALFPLLATRVFKQDFRMDVRQLDILKTWPVRGERLIAGELAALLIVISVLELILLLVTTILVARADLPQMMARFLGPEMIVIALLVTIPVCAIQLLIRNAVPLFFPGWAMRPREEQRGFAMMGVRIAEAFANFVVLITALIPAAATGAAAWLLAGRLGANTALILAATTTPAVAILLVEVWLGIRLLGAQYEKLDVSRDLEPGVG